MKLLGLKAVIHQKRYTYNPHKSHHVVKNTLIRKFQKEYKAMGSLFNRFFALYFPWLISWSLSLLNSVELDINSNIYPYQVWITVATFAFNVIMWIVLFIHILFILLKRGKRNFYFDHVSKLIPVRK